MTNKKHSKPKERYMAVIMNDDGLPYIMLTDNLDSAKQFINTYVQHYLIKDFQENRFLVHSDHPELNTNKGDVYA